MNKKAFLTQVLVHVRALHIKRIEIIPGSYWPRMLSYCSAQGRSFLVHSDHESQALEPRPQCLLVHIYLRKE